MPGENQSDSYTVESAIALAREADAYNLFDHSIDENEEELLSMRRGAVVATAAIALNLRDRFTQEDIKWARDVLKRAIQLPEKPDRMRSPSSIIPWHHAIFVARGLAADLQEGTAESDAIRNLLGLIAHPLEVVSLTAFEEVCKLWRKDPKLTWTALILALSLCHISPQPRVNSHQQSEDPCSSSEVQAAIDAALEFYENGSDWLPLPLPPQAWVKVKLGEVRSWHQAYEDYDVDDAVEENEVWSEPNVFWDSKQAAEFVNRIPFDEVLSSSAKITFLDFLAGALDWTNQKNAPPWVKTGRRDRLPTQLIEWTDILGSVLGQVAGLLPLNEFQPRFLDPILALEGDNCWALLSPFASTYICAYVYDAPSVPADAIDTLDLCLERFLRDSAFKRGTYWSGKFSGFDQPRLVNTLMFVSVEHADLAARYANGDWSEISRILPLIDRFVLAGGWAASVMDPFLTLCERAKTNYPAEAFAGQVLAIIGDGPASLKGWHGTFLPARIAELVQYFTHRDAPMQMALAQKFLRILDMLVDMGDRRSAALQLSEAFREIRFPS